MYRREAVAEVEPMTLAERLKYLRLIQPRYLQVARRERGHLLDEAERVTHRHRKSLIRRLKGDLTRKPRTRQRSRAYGPEVESAVRLVARSLDFPCAERLQPALVPMAQALASHGELVLSRTCWNAWSGSVSRRSGAWCSGCAATATSPVWLAPGPLRPIPSLAKSPPAACPATCPIRATSKSTWFTTAEIAPTASTSAACN